MTSSLEEKMKSAELSTAMMTWEDTPYRTIRSLTNEQAGEKAAKVAREFYEPLMEAVQATLDSWDQESLIDALDGLAEAYREISSIMET